MSIPKLVLMLVCLMAIPLESKDAPKEAKVTPHPEIIHLSEKRAFR